MDSCKLLIYKNARCVTALVAKLEKALIKLKLKSLNLKTEVKKDLNILEKVQKLILSLSKRNWD